MPSFSSLAASLRRIAREGRAVQAQFGPVARGIEFKLGVALFEVAKRRLCPFDVPRVRGEVFIAELHRSHYGIGGRSGAEYRQTLPYPFFEREVVYKQRRALRERGQRLVRSVRPGIGIHAGIAALPLSKARWAPWAPSTRSTFPREWSASAYFSSGAILP